MRLQQETRDLLWMMFPQQEIWENVGINLGDKVSYDFIIPSYHLVIDVRREYEPYGDVDQEKNAFENGYRWVKLSGTHQKDDREELIRVLNEVYIVDNGEESGRQILAPKLPGDVGYDLICDEDVVCPAGKGVDVPSQVYLEMPGHMYAIITARSSTSKKRLLVLTGILDSGYRGKLYTMTFNPTSDPIEICKGQRLSQVIFFHRTNPTIIPVNQLRPSKRMELGFGSTGH